MIKNKEQFTRVNLKFFSILAQICGKREERKDVETGSDLNEILNSLISEYPDIEKYKQYIRFAVNQTYVDATHQPESGDEIVFITPVSGG